MKPEPEIIKLLYKWSPYVDDYLLNSRAFAFGLFQYNKHHNGQALYINTGMKNILGLDEGKFDPSKFINPDFQTLVNMAAIKGDGLIFDGVLTTGTPLKSRSVQAKVLCRQNLLLVLCEYDISELDTLNNEMVELNQELNNVQRQLIKEKKTLTKTLADLKTAQSKLIESEKMASLGRLVAGFAHEINTPIGIALTASSALTDAQHSIDMMLTREEVDEEELITALETIKECSPLVINNLKRTAELVGSFKRTAIDQSVENFRIYNLKETIKDIVINLNSQFKKTSIIVDVDCPDDIYLYGNPNDVGQLLLNLMINSLLHGFDNGILSGTISIMVKREKDDLFIHYSDTGKGMDDETVRQIFEPFFTTLRARGGTGLGMYICHNIVINRLNGTIRCESIKGKGTDFFISVPIPKESNSTSKQF
ncbi:MAG: HAMP domain-containing histidine kinase [Desulfamplus sp.]|nr:HAMP domain-containing histidine kinase [Desulfamplus sp.]